MATPSVNPREHNEGSLGLAEKQWNSAHARVIYKDGKEVAALESPALTGTPSAPTPDPSTNTTRIATTAWVVTKLLGFVARVMGANGMLASFTSDGALESSGSTLANVLYRANHTGTQAHTTITGLGSLATASGVTAAQISDATALGRNIVKANTAADALALVEGMPNRGLRDTIDVTNDLTISSTHMGAHLNVTDNIILTIPASGVGPGVIMLLLSSSKTVTLAGSNLRDPATGDALVSLVGGLAPHMLFFSDEGNWLVSKGHPTSDDISDATADATPSKVVKRGASGEAAFAAVLISAGGYLWVGAGSSVTVDNGGSISWPSASGYFALTSNADGSITVSTSEVTGLADALALKSDATHDHTASEITDLAPLLAAKADATHSHAMTDVTNLNATLALLESKTVVAAIEDRVTDAESAATTLAGRVTTAENDITTIENDVDDIGAAIVVLQAGGASMTTGITAAVSVANSVTETTVLTKTLDNTFWADGKVVEVVVCGTFLQNIADTWAFNIYYGSTIVGSWTSESGVVSTGSQFKLVTLITCRGTGSTGVLAFDTFLTIDNQVAVIVNGSDSETVNTTVSGSIVAKVQASDSNTDTTIEVTQAYVRQ